MQKTVERDASTDAFSRINSQRRENSDSATASQLSDFVSAYQHSAKEAVALRQFVVDVRSLSKLDHDWNSYGAYPIDNMSVVEAIRATKYLCASGLPLPRAIPLPSGGVQLEWHAKDIDIEIRVHADGTCDVCVEHYATNDEQSFNGVREAALYRLIMFLNKKFAA